MGLPHTPQTIINTIDETALKNKQKSNKQNNLIKYTI